MANEIMLTDPIQRRKIGESGGFWWPSSPLYSGFLWELRKFPVHFTQFSGRSPKLVQKM